MRSTIFILATALLLFSGCEDKATQNEQAPKEEKKEATKTEEKKEEHIILTDTQGDEIKVLNPKENQFVFEGFEDKIVMVNFFTTWCPPCKAEIPHLNNIQHKYQDDLKIISVLLEENKTHSEIISFMNENAVEFTITNSPANYDLAEKIGGVKSIPFMLMYDKNGEYFQHYTGAVPEEMIEADIQKILK